MKNYKRQLTITAAAAMLSLAAACTVYADTIVAGQTRQQEETGGPGAVSSAQTQTSSGTETGTVTVGNSPSGSTNSGVSSGVITSSTGTAALPVVIASDAQNAVAGAVSVNAEYGPNGEVLRLGLSLNGIEGTITYGVYVNNGGYLPWQADGTLAGGTEDSTHVEAIQVALTGAAEKLYNVYYRGVSANAGQHGWACNEELMGTMNRGDYLKSVEVVLVPKEAGAPGSYEGRFYSEHSGYIDVQSSGSTYANGYTGWVDHDRARYYFVNGQAVTGWQYIDGLKFYFNESGALIMDVDEIIGKQDSYVLKVNKTLNCLTVYAKAGESDYIVPVKSMLTSTGDDTPIGTFYTPEKYRWRFMINDTWTQYATRVNAGVMMHSITYETTDPNTLITDGYNKLGVTKSHGCIRLTAANAKWVYDNCKLKTPVVVYEDETNPGPFFKPYQKWIPADQTWDPTDPACADQ